MANSVKVKSFVASTAKYARKSARKADKNKNKKLTRAEGQDAAQRSARRFRPTDKKEVVGGH